MLVSGRLRHSFCDGARAIAFGDGPQPAILIYQGQLSITPWGPIRSVGVLGGGGDACVIASCRRHRLLPTAVSVGARARDGFTEAAYLAFRIGAKPKQKSQD